MLSTYELQWGYRGLVRAWNHSGSIVHVAEIDIIIKYLERSVSKHCRNSDLTVITIYNKLVFVYLLFCFVIFTCLLTF